jgi:predicted phage terminase large subunit-like protein
VRSAGVGTGLAGFGAGLIVIDDPVKNRADAESSNNREKVDDWFKNDVYTRMEPNASIILISTRWHEDDLAGRLQREMAEGGEQWEEISLAALAEPPASAGGEEVTEPNGEHGTRALPAADPLGRSAGEALCPQRYGVETLERYRRKLGSYAFAALYQQRPQSAEGGTFKRAWFGKVIDHVPPGLRWKRGYDLAVSTKTTADFTASFRVATDRAGNLYIADGFRARIEYPEQRRFIVERMQNETATEHGIESAVHGKAVVQELRRDPELRRYALREVRVTADKLTRALAWMNLAEEGKLFLVRGPWVREFVDEVAAFPTGRHDDQIDAVSIAVNMLALARKNMAAGF